jgi:indolepyruvate ferredoxin oxidoreductase beta subunit
MEPAETLRMLSRYGNPNVVTIINPRPIYSIDVTGGQASYPELDELMSAIKRLSAKVWVINATEEAQKMGSAMFANSFLIGALVAVRILPLDNESIEPVLKETFPREIDVNILAFRRGMELVRLG